MDKNSRIYIAGHTGVIGSAIYRKLTMRGYTNLIVKKHSEMDLLNKVAVEDFFKEESPEFVFYCAGMGGNAEFYKAHGADIFYNHILMQTNVIHSSYLYNVKKLLYLGSGACYGDKEQSPFEESDAISSIQRGIMEPYALSKVAGLEMCKVYNQQYGTNFISVLSPHIFSEDLFLKKDSHILEEVIRQIYAAKKNNDKKCNLDIWGEGKRKTQYLHVDDCAEMCIFLMEKYSGIRAVNLVEKQVYSLREIAEEIKKIARYEGVLVFNTEKKENKDRYMKGDYLNTLGWSGEHKTFSERLEEMCVYYNEHFEKTI